MIAREGNVRAVASGGYGGVMALSHSDDDCAARATRARARYPDERSDAGPSRLRVRAAFHAARVTPHAA
jgi:hypothetical protein